MDEKKLASLKTTIRAVLQSSKEGVLARLFSRDLYDMTGESVPYAKLGFPDLDSFFRSIHDTVRIGLNRDGEKTYYCVVDESTAHLHKMISAQRSSKKRKGRGRGKISSARRPTYPQPRKSYYTPRSSSRYGPMATPRSKSYSSSSYISMPRINPVKPVPLESTYQPRTSSNTYQPRLNSVTSVYNKPTVKSTVTVVYNKPTVKSTVTAVSSSHSTYEVPPRFQKQRQQTSRSDSSSSYTTVSTDSHSAYLQSSTDILKGIEDYKSLFQEYIDKKFRRQVDVKLFQSATFDWKASVELNGELYCNTERASSKSEAAQLACKVAITALYENIMKYVDIGKYCTTKLDNCQGNSSQHRVPTKPTKRTREDEWFADRIKELVNSKPNGIWGTRFSVEYKTKYKEEPPAGLLEKLQSWTDIVSVEMIMNKIILYPAKTQQCKTEELTSRLSLIDLKANGDSKKLPHVGSAPAKLSDSALVNRVSDATTAYNLDGCGDDNLRITVSQTGAIRSVSGKSGTTNKVCVEKKKIKILPPRVPAIGSSNQVYISHVESCSEFYVHDNDCNINDIMDEIRDHYELTTKPPPILSDYNIGEHCIAQYSGDICWCRAIILGITQKLKTMDEIHVQFIDFGNQETVTQDRVRELIPMCATSPSLAIPCQLYGVQPLKNESNWSKTANQRFTELTKEELIMKIVELTDGKCSVEITAVDDNVDVKKVLCEEGLVLSTSVTPPDIICDTRVAPPDLQTPNDAYWDVYVSYVGGSTDLCVRLIGPEYSDKLDELEDRMTEYYAANPSDVCGTPVIGQVYAILCEDSYYRVKVSQVTASEVICDFMDHGSTEKVDKSNLRELPQEFIQLPFQGIKSSLVGLEEFSENPKVLEKLIDMALGTVFVAAVVKRGEVTHIELIDTSTAEDISINEECLKLIADEELSPKLPKVGGRVQGYVSHVSDNGQVYLQIQGVGLSRLEELMSDIRLHYAKPTGAEEFVSNPKAGKLYCAKYPEDDNWYRAIVEEVLDRKVKVFYVDYGNREVISVISLREPTKANPHIVTLPYQAVLCRLSGIPIQSDVIEWMGRLLQLVTVDSDITIQVDQEAKGNNPICVRLYLGKTETSLNDILIDEHKPSVVDGANIPLPDDSETSSFTEEFASASNTSLNSTDPKLEASMESINSDNSYMDDTLEYLGNHGDTKVTNESTVFESDNVLYRLSDYDKLPLPPPLSIPDVGEYMDLHVSLVTDPTNFMCQPWNSYDDFDHLVESMKTFYSTHECTCPKIKEGGVYAALYEDDGLWYRVQVKHVLNDCLVAIYMLDLGHYDAVTKDNMQPLISEFRKLPFQAITACLAGVKPPGNHTNFSDQATNRFFELAYRKEYVAHIVNKIAVSQREMKLEVVLIDTSQENVDIYIHSLLIEEGHAVGTSEKR